MYKIIIAVLALSVLAMNGAAASGNKHYHPVAGNHVSHSTDPQPPAAYAMLRCWVPVFGREVMESGCSARDAWESRSLFYQGPTYIGRY